MEHSMIKPSRWVERTFSFGQPVEIFPVVLARLRGTPARARELVAGLSDELLSLRWGNKWSVKEHLGHLTDLHPLDERRLAEFLRGVTTLSPADMTNRATETANHNERPAEVLLERLQGCRGGWMRKLESLGEADLVRQAIHPRLQQQMQLVDWLYFIAEHDDHHLAWMYTLITRSPD